MHYSHYFFPPTHINAAASVSLGCDRSDPLRPRWVLPGSASPEPRCTLHCDGHSDCRDGEEKCVESRCVDLTCSKGQLGERGFISTAREGNNKVGSSAVATCGKGSVLAAGEEERGECTRAEKVVCQVGSVVTSSLPYWLARTERSAK